MFHDDNQKIDRFAKGIICRKARQIIGRAGFTAQDRDDIEQELVLRLLQRLPKFDPAKSHRNVFVTTVIERSVASILRDRQAEKRDHRRVTSLNVMIDINDEGPVEMSETISEDARRPGPDRTAEELTQLRVDVAEVVDDLPPRLRDLAERLKVGSKSEVARDLGLPPTTILRWLERLRRGSEKADLKKLI